MSLPLNISLVLILSLLVRLRVPSTQLAQLAFVSRFDLDFDFEQTYKSLQDAFHTKKLPRAPEIARFIQQCVDNNRLEYVTRLKTLAQAEGPHREKRISLWGLSEMLYYYYQDQ